jgi:hypothetical protein
MALRCLMALRELGIAQRPHEVAADRREILAQLEQVRDISDFRRLGSTPVLV